MDSAVQACFRGHLHRRITVAELLSKKNRLRRGELLLLSGTLYTARDQAHKRLVELLAHKKKLPLDLKRAAIYYCGPAPGYGRHGFGSCGPTTAGRMDSFMAPLLKAGLRLTIGKGRRSAEVERLQQRYGARYLSALGGLGALYGGTVKSWETVAFADLGPEAIYRLEVMGFPLIAL